MDTPPGLASAERRDRYSTQIDRSGTFHTLGLSRDLAKTFLETPEGERHWLHLRQADPKASLQDIDRRAIEHLRSGRDFPRLETIEEPLVKIVPRGDGVSPHSSFFARQSAFDDAIANGYNISRRTPAWPKL